MVKEWTGLGWRQIVSIVVLFFILSYLVNWLSDSGSKKTP